MPEYRYTLSRSWDGGLPTVAWVCLNPSTADESVDDPTTRRIRGFSERWGFGGYVLVNVYPMRATDPTELVQASELERIGPNAQLADGIIIAACLDVSEVILAWGARVAHPRLRYRAAAVVGLVQDACDLQTPHRPVSCLGRTTRGHPKHPLYLANTTARVAW